MSPEWIQIAGLSAVALGTGVLLVVGGLQRPTWKRVLLTPLGVAAALFVALPFSMHMCGRGGAVQQLVVPAIGIALALLLVRRRRLAWIAACVLLAAMVGLSDHYTSAVHEPGWIGIEMDGRPHSWGRSTRLPHTWLTGLYRYEEPDVPEELRSRVEVALSKVSDERRRRFWRELAATELPDRAALGEALVAEVGP